MAKRIVSADTKRPSWVIAIPPVVLSKFCFRELKLGQINILITLVLLFMVVSLLESRRVRAGAFLGFATALKPYGFIFFPYLVVTGHWRARASGLGVLAAAFVLPSIFCTTWVLHRDSGCWLVTHSHWESLVPNRIVDRDP